MNIKVILIVFIVLIIVMLLFNNKEHMTDGDASKLNLEAIQNIASLYNTSGILTVPSLNVANDATISKVLNAKSDINVTNNLSVSGTTKLKGGKVYYDGKYYNDTWFPYIDGINYIRGDTLLEGKLDTKGYHFISDWLGVGTNVNIGGKLTQTIKDVKGNDSSIGMVLHDFDTSPGNKSDGSASYIAEWGNTGRFIDTKMDSQLYEAIIGGFTTSGEPAWVRIRKDLGDKKTIYIETQRSDNVQVLFIPKMYLDGRTWSDIIKK
jgi:hypothetical protein